jgi:hypothetical protein
VPDTIKPPFETTATAPEKNGEVIFSINITINITIDIDIDIDI